MSYPSAQSKPSPSPVDPLERGRFSDGRRTFVVCASSITAPDSFQVYTKGNRADLILIVSGLTTHDLHATWSAEWRALPEEWREWARVNAFRVFHSVRTTEPARSRGVRFCDG